MKNITNLRAKEIDPKDPVIPAIQAKFSATAANLKMLNSYYEWKILT